jgi:hypothetical protein
VFQNNAWPVLFIGIALGTQLELNGKISSGGNFTP